MPPHCDTLDGPVVMAAQAALEKKDVGLILPFAPKAAEDEIRKTFDRTLAVRLREKRRGKSRQYTTAMLGFELFTHHLYQRIVAGADHGETEGGHEP